MSVWLKKTICICDASYFIFDMVTQNHACGTNGKVSVCKHHTPVYPLAFVFNSSHKMLLKSILEDFHEVVCFVFLFVCDC
jgi:hypothetical protein